MTFLNLTFLWGLPLLAVPIAIHLLSRRRQEVVKWGAMQFLTSGSIRRRRIWRVDDLLLMLLRILAVLGLVLALARPVWHGSGPAGGAKREVIFVWDVSMSMGQTWEGKTAFDRLLEQTETLMSQLGATDRIRGLVTVGSGEWLTSESLAARAAEKQHLMSDLRSFGLTETSADWHSVLETAIRAPSPSDMTARLVVIITDGQAEGWRHHDQTAWNDLLKIADSGPVPTAIELHTVTENARPVHNVSVAGLTVPRQLLGSGETFLAEAMIHNHGSQDVPQTAIQWKVDDLSLGQSSAGPLSAGQSARVILKHTAGTAGISRISCELQLEDDLAADNRRDLMLETIDHVPVLLVDDNSETDPLRTDRGYVLAALGQSPELDSDQNQTGPQPSDQQSPNTPEKTSVQETSLNGKSVFQVRVVASQALETEALQSYRAVLMPSADELSDLAVSRVSQYVRQGGALWLATGEGSTPETFNRQFYRNGTGLSPWAVSDAQGDLIKRETFVTIHPPEKEHPATLLLSDTQRLDIDRAKVFRHFPFNTTSARATVPVLLQSGTGEALAIEGLTGRGRVIVQGLPMGVRWSNLPLTQAWVPLVHEWLWYLMQPTAEPLNLQAGETLTVNLPDNASVSRVDVRSPRGTDTPLSVSQQGDRAVARSHATQLPGFYNVSIQIEGRSEQLRRYQVLRLKEESSLARWSAETTKAWSSHKTVRFNPTSPLEMPVTASGIRVGQPVWGLLLLVVIIAMLAELYMARRIASKRFGFRQSGGGTDGAAWSDRLMAPVKFGSSPE